MSSTETFPTPKVLLQAMIIALGVCALTAIWPNRGAPALQVAYGLGFGMMFLSLPFVILYFGARGLSLAPLRRVALGAMGLALLFWLWAFADTFIYPERIDAQAGLAFVVIPVYSAIAAGIVVVLLRVLDRRAGTRSD